MKSLKIILTVSAFILGLLAVAWWAWNHQAEWLARRWASQLEQAPADRLDALLDRITRLGEPAIAVLADALASANPELGERAAVAIVDEMERWRTLPAKSAGRRLTILARALADRIPQFDPQTRRRAAVVAQHILAWPGDEAFGARETIAACETVLRQLSGDSSQLSVDGCPLSVDSRQNGTLADPAGDCHPTTDNGQLTTALTSLPDGLPRPLGAPSADRPLRSLPKGSSSAGDESESGDGSPSIANQPVRLFPVRQSGNRQLSALGSGDNALTAPSGQLTAPPEEILAIIRRLQGSDPAQVAEAETELRQHGFTRSHVAMARQLLDPDPAVRRRLARQLPEVPGLDAVPWLVFLSRDTDADVRLTALTLLATTGDPTLLDEVGERVRSDADPRVQRLAERLGAGRN